MPGRTIDRMPEAWAFSPTKHVRRNARLGHHQLFDDDPPGLRRPARAARGPRGERHRPSPPRLRPRRGGRRPAGPGARGMAGGSGGAGLPGHAEQPDRGSRRGGAGSLPRPWVRRPHRGGRRVADGSRKGVAVLAAHPGPLQTYAAVLGGVPKITPATAPVVAIPTTAGTGSEVGRGAVITFRDGRKLACSRLTSSHVGPCATRISRSACRRC